MRKCPYCNHGIVCVEQGKVYKCPDCYGSGFLNEGGCSGLMTEALGFSEAIKKLGNVTTKQAPFGG